ARSERVRLLAVDEGADGGAAAVAHLGRECAGHLEDDGGAGGVVGRTRESQRRIVADTVVVRAQQERRRAVRAEVSKDVRPGHAQAAYAQARREAAADERGEQTGLDRQDRK